MKVSGDLAYARSNTGSFTVAAPGMEKRKMVNNLQALLKDEIQRRENAQRQLLQYRQRSLMIERQFSRLLEKYDNHVASINGRQTYSSQIWNRLVGEIEKFNDNSEKMLEKRCNEILFMMNRRISEILEKTDDELQKNKKLSEEEYKSVKEQIKQALKLSKEIEVENQELKKMNKDLSFKVSILKEERNLLVQQLSQKKMLLLRMAKTTSQELKESIVSQPKSSRIPRLKSSKRTSQIDNSPIPKFICEPSFRELNPSIDNPEMSRRFSSTSRGNREQMVLKTDNHFKICFQRERRKNNELKSIVARLQAKFKELNNMIEKFNKDMDRQSNPNERLKKLEKLVQNIKFKLLVSPGQDQMGGLNSKDLQTMMQL